MVPNCITQNETDTVPHNLQEVPNRDVVVSPLGTTPYMIFFAVWIGFAGWFANFDQGYSGTVLQMASFNSAFGECAMVPNPATGALVEKCMLTATEQSLTNVSVLFSAVGGFVSGIVGFYLGRRGAILVGFTFVVIGSAGMLGSTGNIVAYIACKSINGFGIGHITASSPMYGVECTPPQKRGMLLGFYGIGLTLGTVVVAGVCLGSSSLVTNWAWQTPIICQIPISIMYGLGITLFPESPRWLLIKGKDEKARRSFGKFYNLDPYAEKIGLQVRDVQDGIEFEKSLSTTTSWTEIFHRSHIRRTCMSAFILCGTTLCGIGFVAVYAAIFLADVGINNPFLVNLVFAICIFAGSFCGPFCNEYLGRRTAMLAGYGSMTLCMFIFSAVSTGLGAMNPVAKNVLIAFLCIWGFCFGGLVAPSAWLAQAEVLSVRLRTYGLAFTSTVFYIFGFASIFWTPFMIGAKYGNMGTNVGYFYGSLDLCLFVGTFLFVPETARLTLEQIDDIFASGRRAWSSSLKRNKQIAKGEVFDVSPEAHFAAIQHMREKE